MTGVRLVTSDDHAGLRAAIARHFQGAGWPRCQVHFARGLLGLVGAGKRQDLAAGLRLVFAAHTREQALTAARQLADAWRGRHPKIAQALEDELEDCLACLVFPVAHQLRLRTTNGLERFNQELKRRTRVVRIFPNRGACLRLVSALCMEQSEEWVSGRRYLDMALSGTSGCSGGALEVRRALWGVRGRNATMLIMPLGVCWRRQAPVTGAEEERMTAAAGVEQAIVQFYDALSHLINGDNAPMDAILSHRDDATAFLGWGGYERGWAQLGSRWAWATSQFAGGRVTAENISMVVTDDLGYTVALERGRVRLVGATSRSR